MIPQLNELALGIGHSVRKEINSLTLEQRAQTEPSTLKGLNTRLVDSLGEKIIFQELEKAANEQEIYFGVVVAPKEEGIHYIGEKRNKVTYCLADPVDGTIKLAGLGNTSKILRMGNDGIWGFSISFTEPTDKPITEIKVNDFKFSTLVDGNPVMYQSYPFNATSFLDGGILKTFEVLERANFGKKKNETMQIGMSSQENLGQGIVAYDAFQGFDRKTAQTGTESLSIEVYRKLMNRNEGGAFDIWRIYGTAGDMLRTILGYRGGKPFEPQGVARIATNDCLDNCIPSYSIIRGAGGEVVDFQGRDIGERKLTEGRPNILYAANHVVKEKILSLLSQS